MMARPDKDIVTIAGRELVLPFGLTDEPRKAGNWAYRVRPPADGLVNVGIKPASAEAREFEAMFTNKNTESKTQALTQALEHLDTLMEIFDGHPYGSRQRPGRTGVSGVRFSSNGGRMQLRVSGYDDQGKAEDVLVVKVQTDLLTTESDRKALEVCKRERKYQLAREHRRQHQLVKEYLNLLK